MSSSTYIDLNQGDDSSSSDEEEQQPGSPPSRSPSSPITILTSASPTAPPVLSPQSSSTNSASKKRIHSSLGDSSSNASASAAATTTAAAAAANDDDDRSSQNSAAQKRVRVQDNEDRGNNSNSGGSSNGGGGSDESVVFLSPTLENTEDEKRQLKKMLQDDSTLTGDARSDDMLDALVDRVSLTSVMQVSQILGHVPIGHIVFALEDRYCDVSRALDYFLSDDYVKQCAIAPAPAPSSSSSFSSTAAASMRRQEVSGGEANDSGRRNEKINIIAALSDGTTKCQFKMKRSSKFTKMLESLKMFPELAGKSFHLQTADGDRVDPDSTPEDYGIEDSDQIDVILH